MELIHTHCAGLDVHKKTVVACIRIPGPDGKPLKHTRTFSTMTADLFALARAIIHAKLANQRALLEITGWAGAGLDPYLGAFHSVEDGRPSLKGYGRRMQLSVFECRLSGQELAALTGELLAMIERGADSVRCYPLDADAVRRIVILGVGEVTPEPTHSMF